MLSKLVISGKVAVAALLLAFLVGLTATWFKQRQEIDQVPDQQKIARSLEIIRTSTPTKHKVLKVLFYGQSITRSGWHNAVVAHWRKRYPNTVFVVENRALGGFAAQYLVRTTEQDIAAFYPDLIIFHVYGDHRAYEKILRMFRSLTAADVILQTDHGDVDPEPPAPVCNEGLQLSLKPQPGCAGLLWVHQESWHDEMSYHRIPAFGKKYGMAVEPQRNWWREYLLRTHVDPRSLLMPDGLHPNDNGKQLIAEFFNSYFDKLVDQWDGEKGNTVRTITVSASGQTDRMKTVTFQGTRLEMISDQEIAVWPSITIDQRSLNDLDGCYQVTRSTPLVSVPDWPALRRITLRHNHTAEDWTATITKITPDQKSIEFAVKASVSGDQGIGNSSTTFVAKSGNLSIDGQDWMFAAGYELNKIPLEVPTEVHWSVHDICSGRPEVIDTGGGNMQYRYVLAAGLPNEKHAITFSFPPNDHLVANEFLAYRPALRD